MTISSLAELAAKPLPRSSTPPEVAILGISQAGIRPVWDGAAVLTENGCSSGLEL